MKQLLVVAIDPSLTALGWAASTGAVGVVRPGGLSGPERLDYLDTSVQLLTGGAQLVVLEGYAYNYRPDQSSSMIDLGELGGVLRMGLWRRGTPCVEVSPSSRAMYATGNGRAGKDEVFAEAIRRLGYTGRSKDEADALWLLAMARDRYLLPGSLLLPDKHRRALEKVKWPKL